MIRIDKEIIILVTSFFALCVVATLMAVNSKAVVTAIDSSYQTPSQKLLNNTSGCNLENITQVPSTKNSGLDYLILYRCIE